MKKLILIVALAWASHVGAQNLTLGECYEKARQNFPLIQQKELLLKSKDYTVANASSGYLPQLSIAGQATYQSDVTKVPIDVPGFAVKPLAKDQYKIYAEVNQSLYDGGTIKRQNAISETNAQLEDQKVEVELYKIRERVNQIFFGILLIDEQLIQVDLVKKDLLSSIEKVEASIQNGIAFKTNADILQAELLKTDQRAIELTAGRRAYLLMLGVFIGQELGDATALETPAETTSVISTDASNISRPELSMYNFQTQVLTAQQQLNNTKVLPRVGLFVQGGYGRPGLNVLKNEFSTYYIGGLRLNWNLSGFYNTKRDREQLQLNLQGVEVQKQVFLFNTKLTLHQQSSEMTKLKDLIRVDDKIIELRTKIKTTAKSQLDNGVITANDYLRELNAEDQAKQNRSLHGIQLLMTQYNYISTTGTN